jgi:hypothetical protein
VKQSKLVVSIFCCAAFLAACGQSTPAATVPPTIAATSTVAAPVATETPVATNTPEPPAPTATTASTAEVAQAAGGKYEPVSAEVCKIIQEDAANALSATFTLEASVPFTDTLSGEAGQGCQLTATGTGTQFKNPSDVVAKLVKAFVGWTEQISYQADGPTGSATALTRDAGLLLVSANWQPGPEVSCPADQPISACDVKPEQQHYTIQIQVAQK